MDKEKELFNTALGKRVKEARRAAGLKGEEAAEMAGITAQFLSEVERGKKGITSYNLAPLDLRLSALRQAGCGRAGSAHRGAPDRPAPGPVRHGHRGAGIRPCNY